MGWQCRPVGAFWPWHLALEVDMGEQLHSFPFCKRSLILSLLLCSSEQKGLLGTPKGITFSPDATAILVAFADLNSLAIFDIDTTCGEIEPEPKQVLSGSTTLISRPEDVKISPDGKLACAFKQSEAHSELLSL